MTHVLLAATLAVTLQQTDTTFDVRANGRLELENFQGQIVVRSWEREQVRVRARHAANMRVDIDRTGSTVSIEGRNRRGAPGDIAYDISVPRSFEIEIEAINSGIEVADVNGDVNVETINGHIALSGIAGRIYASSTQGRVTVRDSRGTLYAETVNEAIAVSNHNGDIDAETVNGGITLTGIRAGEVNAETVNGSVQYDGEIRSSGRYDLSTHNGGITITIPEGTNATVDVETYNGELEADFPIQLRGSTAQRRTSFTIGNGGARIQLESFGGNIHLRRPGRTRER
jgi:DUF4097 and DUF4098 domain-containing protein YvlB